MASKSVPIEELLVSSLATNNAIAKLLVEKGIITQREFLQKIAAERATYQAMLKPGEGIGAWHNNLTNLGFLREG